METEPTLAIAETFRQLQGLADKLGVTFQELIPYGTQALQATLVTELALLTGFSILFAIGLGLLAWYIRSNNNTDGMACFVVVVTLIGLIGAFTSGICGVVTYNEIKYAPEFHGARRIIELVKPSTSD